MKKFFLSTDYFFESRPGEGGGEYNFTTDQDQIRSALADSKNNETMIALSVPNISANIFVTCVSNIIEHEGEIIIVLKEYDATGFMIERNKIKLQEITGVCPLTSKWCNPFLKIGVKNNVPWIKFDDRL